MPAGLLRLRRGEASPPAQGNSFERATVDSLGNQALGWWALAGLGYRVAVTPAIITSTVATLGSAATPFVWALGAVLIVDVVLLGSVAMGRLRWLLRSNAFLAWEILIAVVLNLWMSLAMPPGTFASGGHDAFWWYGMGTVALWTGLRGAGTGAAMVAGAGMLELAMFRVNHTPLDSAGSLQLLLRYAWMCTLFGGAMVVKGLAQQGARLAVAAGLRAGQAAQRADMLRQMHDTVLQTLEGLALRLGTGWQSAEERLREAHAIALAQAGDLQAMLHADTASAQPGLDARLQGLRHDFQRRGLHVDLVTAGALGPDPSPQVLEAVEGAVREALTNVAKHAGVATAAVRATVTADRIQVSVSDRGRGFDPASARAGYGLAGSIHARMAEVGGTAAVWSSPGKGARLRLRVDTPSTPPARGDLASRWTRPVTVRLARLQASVAGVPPAASAAAAQSFGWFAVAVLAYRVAVVPITAFNFLAVVPGEFPPATLAVVLGSLLIANLALLLGSLSGRLRGLLESNTFLGVDVGVAVLLFLWAGGLLPRGSFFLLSRDVFLVYALSVVVLWTTLRGAWTGLVLLGGSALLELLTGLVNGVALDAVDWSEFVSRFSTSCLAVVLPLVVMAFARQGGHVQAAEGLRAGRETERARLLRDTNQLALHTLHRIAAQAGAAELSAAERLRDVRALARDQAAQLRAVLHADTQHPRVGLAAGLRALAADARRTGLPVELVIGQLDRKFRDDLGAALLEATRQALATAAGAAATRAVVRATARPDGIEITIRYHSASSDPADNPEAVGADHHQVGERLRAIGGRVAVWSAPGRGARVTLWAPA